MKGPRRGRMLAISGCVVLLAGAITLGGSLPAWGTLNHLIFDGPTTFTANPNPFTVANGDFNWDGHPDFAAASTASDTVSVFLGDGDGGFSQTASIAIAAPPQENRPVISVRANADQYSDVIAGAGSFGGEGLLHVLLSNGAGGISTDTTVPCGGLPQALSALDLDGDTRAEWLGAADINDNLVWLYQGSDVGTYSVESTTLVGAGPDGVALADLNADDHVDFVTACESGASVEAYLNDGTEHFTRSWVATFTSGAENCAVGRFNSDSVMDIAVCLNDGGVRTFLGTGTGSFTPSTTTTIAAGPWQMAPGDVNNDGRTDLVAASKNGPGLKTVSVLVGNGSGGFSVGATPSVAATSATGVSLADFDTDGRLDIFASSHVYGPPATTDNIAQFHNLSWGPTAYVPVAGANRIETAIQASQKAYPDELDPFGRQTVVIATSVNWPDALGGAALASTVEGPILLTPPDSLPTSVRDEIVRLRAARAIILGGTGAVSQHVEDQLNAMLPIVMLSDRRTSPGNARQAFTPMPKVLRIARDTLRDREQRGHDDRRVPRAEV